MTYPVLQNIIKCENRDMDFDVTKAWYNGYLLGEDFIKIHRGCLVSAMAVHDITDNINLSNGETLEVIDNACSKQEPLGSLMIVKAFTGASGCGKSTVLKLLLGLYKPLPHWMPTPREKCFKISSL